MTVCTRCVMDTSDPDIPFDSDGVCNHCRHADEVLPTVRWTAAESEARPRVGRAEDPRRGGRQASTTRSSASAAASTARTPRSLAHRMGLRPLAVHLDNGWDSELAVENIQRVVERCGFDLVTYVIDWREFRDLQRCVPAGVRRRHRDADRPRDRRRDASGSRASTACATSSAEQRRDRARIARGAGCGTSRTGPTSRRSTGRTERSRCRRSRTSRRSRWLALQATGQIRVVPLLDLVPYRRDEAAATLAREFGWREYGGKHHESLFTKFYQGAILPTKFGIDKRRVHLSDRLRNGELTRAEALAAARRCRSTSADELRVESDYVRKKLGFDEAEWAAIMAAPPRSHAGVRLGPHRRGAHPGGGAGPWGALSAARRARARDRVASRDVLGRDRERGRPDATGHPLRTDAG